MRHPLPRAAAALAVLALAGSATAQANTDPGIDVRLGILGNLAWLDREGVYPGGMNAAAMNTTVCNQGARVNWFRAMDPDHPFIAFLVARESDGRFEQISDRSWVKHGFFALTSSQCTPCTPPGGLAGTYLGVGCSDTYDITNNGDNYWLGPPSEIDPWLGAWDPVCSFFDLGTGGAVAPDDCNGLRTFSQSQAVALGPLGHRIRLSDADLGVAGASYWYQGQYVVAREAESKRGDNLGSRGFDPVWDGTRWGLIEEPEPVVHGSILQRWSGASLDSVANGGDDGRVYVAARVSGPEDGLWHWELALHNRDNARGIAALRLPVCPGARVLNAGFRDLDQDAANDWSVARAGAELVLADASGANALRWNSIYNVWFDSDAAPLDATATLVEADPGAGLDELAVGCPAPLALYNAFAGAGCSLDGTPPALFASGAPARAALGNASFALESTGNVPGALQVLATSDAPAGTIALGPCSLLVAGSLDQVYALASATSDASGRATFALPVPADLAFEGLTLTFQTVGVNPLGGPLFGKIELSDALSVRVGDAIPSCP